MALSKRELLDALRKSGDRVLSALRAVPEEAFEAGRYEGGGNGRQILAHIASIEWTYPRLIAVARGARAAASATDPAPQTRTMRGGNDDYNARQVAKRSPTSSRSETTIPQWSRPSRA